MPATRQLLAIMFTDIEGYTALMQKSEALAIEYRNQHREIFDGVTLKYQGKIIQYFGDGTLSFFESAVHAVECATEMQKRFLKESSIPVRIGIHMGDVVITEDDLIGDAVNLASRVESLAVPGSVLVSDKVVDELTGHEKILTRYMGRYHFKNDQKSREIFAIQDPELVLPKPAQLKGKIEKKRNIPRTLLLYSVTAWLFLQLFNFIIARQNWDPLLLDVMIIVLFFGLTTTFILTRFRPRIGWLSFSLLAINGVLAMVTLGSFVLNPTILELSQSVILNPFDHNPVIIDESLKSLAVLPFSNYTGDKNQDYLYAGMHDGLISEIGVLSGIRITSHTSSMVYVNSNKSLKKIAKELGVDAIIEASMTRIDSVIEFRIKLVDVFPQEETIWTHEYHTALDDVPNMYKEVTRNVALLRSINIFSRRL